MTHTILIVDDSAEEREHIKAILSEAPEGFRTLTAGNGMDAFMMLVSKQVDLVLCDVMMPVLDGLKFLALKGSRPDLIDVPVIMLTVIEEVGKKVRALEAGATDCLTKPCHKAELLARVRVHLNARLYHRELRKKNAELERLSNTDTMTGLANRRHFLRLAEVELLRAMQDGGRMALIMVDIDHFKSINDDYGHLVGDRVIQSVAEVLGVGLRQGEVAARYGGEEFALLLPDTSAEDAVHLARRCRSNLKQLRLDVAGHALSMRAQASRPYTVTPERPSGQPHVHPSGHPNLHPRGHPNVQPHVHPSGHPNLHPSGQPEPRIAWSEEPPSLPDELEVTASFGVAGYPSPSVENVDDLLRCADRALYRAKASGRDRVVSYDAPTAPKDKDSGAPAR